MWHSSRRLLHIPTFDYPIFLKEISMKLRILLLLSFCLHLLAACGGVRLQTASEATNEVNKSFQYQAERQCDKYDGQQRMDCQRQVRSEYEAQRRKNTEANQ
jgi:hypothetical protein